LTDTITSDNESREARLYRSKFEEPDHVPILNYDDVGSADKAGYRIIALKDSLIILKEDGIWRLSGASESSFYIPIRGW
jgi:hypothetical protein